MSKENYTGGSSWGVEYRPERLEDIVGLHPQVQTIRGMLRSKQIPNVLGLFGPTGCGKTTISQIIARSVNGTLSSDWHDLNISDQRGIDSMREATRMGTIAPMHHLRFIFLDEIHAATPQAISALLKPAERKGSRTCYILASSKPELLLQDLLGRTTKIMLDFPTVDELSGLLHRVARQHRSPLAKQRRALPMIAEAAGCQPREALNLLQSLHNSVIGGADLSRAAIHRAVVQQLAGGVDKAATAVLVALHSGDVPGLLAAFAQTKEYANLLAKLLDLNQFVLHKQCKTWTYSSAARERALVALRGALKSGECKLSLGKTVRIQNGLVDMQIENRTSNMGDYFQLSARLVALALGKVD